MISILHEKDKRSLPGILKYRSRLGVQVRDRFGLKARHRVKFGDTIRIKNRVLLKVKASLSMQIGKLCKCTAFRL